MKKKKNAITYKVWIEVEAYDEETGDGDDVDLGWASEASFSTELEAVQYATRIHDWSQVFSARLAPSPVLTEEQEREAGLYLAEVLGLAMYTVKTAPDLPRSFAGRYLLGAGYQPKTPVGLYRTVANIVQRVQAGQTLPL